MAAQFLVLLWIILFNLGEVLLESELHYVPKTLGRQRRAGRWFLSVHLKKIVEGVPAHGMGLRLCDL